MGKDKTITLFLAGDVMCGRGIDQIMPSPVNPHLYEPWIKDAREYVTLAENVNGDIPRNVEYSYIWGDALAVFEKMQPDALIVNLETSITQSETPWPYKGINYRMHPDNGKFLQAAHINCCTLANNHVVDWDYAGLRDTTDVLNRAGIAHCGAGKSVDEALAPAIIETKTARVLVFAFGFESSGVPSQWAASKDKSGVAFYPDMSQKTVADLKNRILSQKKPGDIVVASVHWGENWDYTITKKEREFAHSLTTEAGVDVFFGHSSHHVKAIEIYEGKPILYGCGDFINDYEGIKGYREYRGDLELMYFLTLNSSSGTLQKAELVPVTMKRFRVMRLFGDDILAVKEIVDRESEKFGVFVENQGGVLVVKKKRG
ncbi:CapA family protein [Chitinispirillales bacterium ANBcel5]|uniref:CapA family protein n=1 Tax=Cellulosispirillum alkaliphilum TaxID=3039283 RepID=UPI002A55A3DB|nr:CapA family protein [Chitinispirillales bacterium ANBcel5]